MRLLRFVALVFIDFFGITHSSVEARDRDALYIVFLLIGLLMSLCFVLFLTLKAVKV